MPKKVDMKAKKKEGDSEGKRLEIQGIPPRLITAAFAKSQRRKEENVGNTDHFRGMTKIIHF